MDKGYTVIESFEDHLSFVIPPSCFETLRLSRMVSHISLHGLFKFILGSFDCDEELQEEGTCT